MGNITITHFVNNILPTITWDIKIIIASEDYTFPKGDKDSRHSFYHDKVERVPKTGPGGVLVFGLG